MKGEMKEPGLPGASMRWLQGSKKLNLTDRLVSMLLLPWFSFLSFPVLESTCSGSKVSESESDFSSIWLHKTVVKPYLRKTLTNSPPRLWAVGKNEFPQKHLEWYVKKKWVIIIQFEEYIGKSNEWKLGNLDSNFSASII